MSHALKVRSVGLLLLAALILGAIWFSPLGSLLGHKSTTPARAASLPPNHTSADGPYKVQGNAILGVDGARYIFHGVGRDGLEFSCTGDKYMDAAHLAFMGPGTSGAAGTYWWSNTVRLPLSEGFWLRGYSAQFCSATQYQALVKQIVTTLTAMKLNVIIDLQWTDAGGQSQGGGAGWAMSDSDSVTFWTQVAGIYKSYSNVLFELYNEPHPSSWTIWQQGGTITDTSYEVSCNCTQTFTYKAVGMQALVNTVRTTAGATNLVLVGGNGWGYDLSQATTITGTNVVYDTHPYPYPGKQPANWDASFGNVSATVPVMSAENGEYDCHSSYMSQLLPYFDAHLIGWTAWAWYSVGSQCKYPQVVADYQGTPAPNMGAYIYQYLLGYAGMTPPPPAAGPIKNTWYFAEGRVGAHFNEYLVMGNPTSSNCSVSIHYLYTPDHGTAQTKTVSVNVPAEQRVTEVVDTDLGTSLTGMGIIDSAIVTASGCPGIVAERPMYFINAFGVSSGSDTVGATSLGTSFYFADLAEGSQPGSGTYSSFLTILNPPSSVAAATVTATYSANGKALATQQLAVPIGTRGTIFPMNVTPHLPAHVAVALTSTQPVVIERPAYFSTLSAGNAGVVSGAADIRGVQAPSNDWLFAEGYTGSGFQENFAIANFDPTTAASVTIKLEYGNGTVHSFPVKVAPLSQLIWNVNVGGGANPPTPSVSAEITSTGAGIAVEREMFFRYNISISGHSTPTVGGTDVLGAVGPLPSAGVYSFAEGYVNNGYVEFLTIQNPTANAETITVTLADEAGIFFTFQVVVGASSRYTIDVGNIVLAYMYHSGDGVNGYEVSMALQSSSSFVAERPMYLNASGTQGGTDAVGFSG